jgi:hypothetical protein
VLADEVLQSRLHVLGTAYYRSGSLLECYDLLRGYFKTTSSLNHKCRLLLATVACDLDK